MTSGFKKPGILRTGFDYQDLAAISVLIDFYRQPKVYEWVELDSDDPKFASVDDIVALRTDGKYAITQVKFTIDPSDPANALSWDWLLKRKGAGKSLLQKWSATVFEHSKEGALHSASLFTDRVPDAQFTKALRGKLLDPRRLDPVTAKRINQQLPNAAVRAAFFANFRFEHSQPHVDDFEYELKAKLIPSDIDDDLGWIALANAVKEWATRKRSPEPDGRVRHVHIRAKLSRDRPRPIPQNFEVPHGYQPPDAAFDTKLLQRVATTDGVSVVWGSPGRGKSTYLSHCFAKLLDRKLICIRHHYFINLAERGTARFFFPEIEHSLTRQLEEQLPELSVKGKDLSAWLDAASSKVTELGRRLVIIVDGLDHVWREGRSLDQMQQMFAHLLPARPNTHIIIGTQRIANKHLPHRLLQFCPQHDWLELPLMSAEAIGHWLRVQHHSGRLMLQDGARPVNAVINSLARAFHKVTLGVPLHLIYAFEKLARRGGPVTKGAILQLPPSPSDDIRDYYAALWVRVSATARAILHGLASIDFPMPVGGIHQCFLTSAGTAEAIEEIDHLLDHRPTGTFPFHGSIFVYVREQADHAAHAKALEPIFLNWLAGPAPEYWKWAWTWLTKAKFGDENALLAGPDRPWALQAFHDGMPPDQVDLILRQAEEVAFKRLDFPRANALRSIRIRGLNAPEFQTSKFGQYTEVALKLATQDYRLLQIQSALATEAPDVIQALLRTLAPQAASATAAAALNEFNRRIRMSDRFDGRQHDWPGTLARVVPYCEPVEPSRLAQYAKRVGQEDGLIAAAINESVVAGRYLTGVAFAALHAGPECRKALFALLCVSGIDIDQHPDLKARNSAQLVVLSAMKGWRRAKRKPPLRIDTLKVFPPGKVIDRELNTRGLFHSFFFQVLNTALGGRSEKVVFERMDLVEDGWRREAAEVFGQAALWIAAEVDEGKALPPVKGVFELLDVPKNKGRSYDDRQMAMGARMAAADIAFDLQLLRQAHDPNVLIDVGELPTLDLSELWNDETWLYLCITRRLPIHTEGGAAELLDRIEAQLNGTVTPFMERADLWIDAAVFALDNGLDQRARHFHKRATDCLFGYGYRKDSFGFEVVEAVQLLAKKDRKAARALTLKLAAAFEQITEYTDGDETDHVRSDFYELVADLQPNLAAAVYGELIRTDDWRYAQKLLSHFAKSLDPAKPHDLALVKTFIEPTELCDARALSNRHGKAGTDLVDYLERLVGHSRTIRDDFPRSTDINDRDRRPSKAPLPKAFPPGVLKQYLAAVQAGSGYSWKEGAATNWLRDWAKAGRAVDALDDLRTCLNDPDFSLTFSTICDHAFPISLKAEGTARAFDWLVAAQRHRRGWSRFYVSNKENERRLALVAKHYRSRWKEFIVRSAEPIRYEGERGTMVFGQVTLVSFLLRVGQVELARDFTAALADVLLSELSDQPLPKPAWLQ